MGNKDISPEERCEQYRRQLGGMQAAHNKLKTANGRLTETVNKQEMKIRELEAKLQKEKELVKDLLDACGSCDELIERDIQIRSLKERPKDDDE